MSARYRRCRQRRRGFTLIEVLLVLVILVILGSMVVFQVGRSQKKALVNQAKAQIGAFELPLGQYHLDVLDYPSPSAGLEALRSQPADLANPAKWNGPYLNKQVPLDPWGRPYQYMAPGKMNLDGFDIWSFGPDGVDGTEDDIGNWDQQNY